MPVCFGVEPRSQPGFDVRLVLGAEQFGQVSLRRNTCRVCWFGLQFRTDQLLGAAAPGRHFSRLIHKKERVADAFQ